MIHTSHSLSDTQKLAKQFVKYVANSTYQNQVTVFGFSGDLGSGKTTFTQCVAKMLGITDHVTSPTFIIEKIYPITHTDFPNFPFKKLIHIDAYRLANGEELAMLNFKKDLEDPSNLILIEWPERVIEILPKTTPIISFSFVSEHVRTIEFPAIIGI